VESKRPNPELWKPVEWIGGSRKIVRSFPKDVRRRIGQALVYAQAGGKHLDAKRMKGNLRGAHELSVSSTGDAFRVVYVADFGNIVYVIHAFTKKSTVGSKTPKRHIETIERRMKFARDRYEKAREN
jgi:phage-related protein